MWPLACIIVGSKNSRDAPYRPGDTQTCEEWIILLAVVCGVSNREQRVKADPKIEKWVSCTSKDVFIVHWDFHYLINSSALFSFISKAWVCPHSHLLLNRLLCGGQSYCLELSLMGLTARREDERSFSISMPRPPKVEDWWAHIHLVKTLPLRFTMINPLLHHGI